MKPLLLKIAGLNSFRDEQIIDFTQLCKSGVFGIFGPTGSGKSTILDGLTLALYGKVERARGGTQGIINQNEEKAEVYFAFQIGGRKFIAQRIYKKGADGSINQSRCRLVEETPQGLEILAEKKREMDEKIQDILGLTVEDFTRAVVLPQGKFQEFLTLQGAERRRMLQRIFALEKYGEELTQRIRNRLAEAKNKEGQLESRQNELGNASLEALTQGEENLLKASTLLEDLKAQGKVLNGKKEEYQQILTLQSEYQQGKSELARLQKREKEIILQKEKLTKAIKAEKLKPFIAILKQEVANKEKVLANTTRLKEKVAHINGDYGEAEKNFLFWQNKLNEEGEFLKEKIIKLEEGIKIEEKRDALAQQRKELLVRYQSYDKSCQNLLTDIAGLNEQRERLREKQQLLAREIEEKEILVKEEEVILRQKEAWQKLQDVGKRYTDFMKEKRAKEESYRDISQKREDFLKEFTEINEQLSLQEKRLHSLKEPLLNQSQLNSRREQLVQWEKNIFTLKHYYSLQKSKEQERGKLEKEKLDLEKNLAEKNNQYNQIVFQRDVILQEIRELEKEIKSQELHNYAALLRDQLEGGKPCPVCGSLEHGQKIWQEEKGIPLNSLQNKLVAHKEQEKEIAEQLQNIFQQTTRLKVKLSDIIASLENIAQEGEDLAEKYQQSLAALPTQWKDLTPPEMEEKYRDYLQEYQQQQQALENYLREKEKLVAHIEKIRGLYGEKNILLKQTEAKVDSLKEDIAFLQNREQGLLAEKEEKEKNFQLLAPGLQGEDILNKYEKLKEAKKALDNLRKEEKSLLSHSDQLQDQLQRKNEQVMDLRQKLESVRLEGQNCSNLIQELTEKIKEITAGGKAQEVKNRMEEKLAQIKASYEKGMAQKEEKRRQLEESKRILYSLEQELKQAEGRIAASQEDLNKKLQEFAFSSLAEVEANLVSPEELKGWEKEIDEYQKLIAVYAENIASIEKKLAGRNISQEQWEEFKKKFDNFNKELELQMEKVHNLTFQVKILRENHIRWSELEKERKKLLKEIDQLQVLEKLFKGNAFVQFIAEEQLHHVALDASRRLGELTNYRYGLEIDSEGGFIIRDDSNGGLRRPVATLSGGETFLTSLALALALSSQIQLRGKYPLEFFFLDEGFGTLDNHLLETVMNSLERLQKEEMTIGIISHVPELRARMARSLLVEPAERGGPGSRVAISLA